MDLTPLQCIDWHDLPVSALRIGNDGIELTFARHDDATGAYTTLRLSLRAPQQVRFDIAGQTSAGDLADLEISTFRYTATAEGRLDGQLGLLPGRAGYWTLTFEAAEWRLDEIADALPAVTAASAP